MVLAANHFGRFFTGQITAAGKVPPAKVTFCKFKGVISSSLESFLSPSCEPGQTPSCTVVKMDVSVTTRSWLLEVEWLVWQQQGQPSRWGL